MDTKHEIPTCPICSEPTLRVVSCTHPSCKFTVTSCTRCDRDQAVSAFMADHELGCEHNLNTLLSGPVSFRAPQRKAA